MRGDRQVPESLQVPAALAAAYAALPFVRLGAGSY
jgi:hypothetical protein